MSAAMATKKLYRIPEEGMVRGVCAGLARYLDVPVRLVRVAVVLSMVCGLFMLTIAAYVILCFMLDPAPPEAVEETDPHHLLAQADEILRDSEQRLRVAERYITSDLFSVQNQFRNL